MTRSNTRRHQPATQEPQRHPEYIDAAQEVVYDGGYTFGTGWVSCAAHCGRRVIGTLYRVNAKLCRICAGNGAVLFSTHGDPTS